MASRNSWLSSVGDYGTLVRNLAVSDPRLRQRDPKLVRQGTPWENATSKAVIFQKLDGVGQFSTSLPFCDGPSLSKFLDDPSSQGQDDQQLVVVQGLNPEIIGAIGCHFRMHPSFFVEHEKAVVIAPRDGGEGDGPVLPSMAMTREHMTFKYYESFTLPENLQGNFTLCCADSGRHIGVTRLRGQFSRVGMLRRKCSLWRRQRHGGKGWDMVLLTDPPLRAAQIKRGVPDILIKPAPLQGGYVDFIPHDVQSRMPFGPPRSSMMDDISFYLTHHAATFHFDTPDAVKLMVMKIVASHYMQHVEFINGIVSHAQWTMSRHDSIASLSVSNVEAQWSDAQALGRRVNEYCEDLEWIMLQCRIPLECPDTSRAVPAASSWQDATVDYQFLHMRYSSIRTRAESLNSSMAALVGMAGNQHSLSEAKRTRALTILGLMFIPLAYVSSLFSMADDYLPGQARFWLYFAVSLPLIFIVFALYALVDVGMLNIVTLIGELVRRNKT